VPPAGPGAGPEESPAPPPPGPRPAAAAVPAHPRCPPPGARFMPLYSGKAPQSPCCPLVAEGQVQLHLPGNQAPALSSVRGKAVSQAAASLGRSIFCRPPLSKRLKEPQLLLCCWRRRSRPCSVGFSINPSRQGRGPSPRACRSSPSLRLTARQALSAHHSDRDQVQGQLFPGHCRCGSAGSPWQAHRRLPHSPSDAPCCLGHSCISPVDAGACRLQGIQTERLFGCTPPFSAPPAWLCACRVVLSRAQSLSNRAGWVIAP